MPGAQRGNRYFGRIDGHPTEAIFIAKKQNAALADSPPFYVLAIPCNEGEERAHQVRSSQDFPTQEQPPMFARLVALARINHLQLTVPTPRKLPEYTRFASPPQLEDLERLLTIRAALPVVFNQGAAAQVQFSETEAEEGDVPSEPDNFDAANLFSEPKPFADLFDGQTYPPLGPRPPAAPPPTQMSSAFGDLGAEFDFVRRSAPQMPHSTPRPVAPTQATIANAAAGPPPEFYASMVQALGAIAERVGGSQTHHTGISGAQASLFKLQGARGRVAQDELDRLFDQAPEGVVAAFEEAVMRRAGGLASASRAGLHGGGPLESAEARAPALLLGTWRETVPAREHATLARVGEAVIDAYRSIREGRPMRAAARLALLIGAMEQACLDAGRWAPRAQHLSGMPPVPLQVYTALTPEEKRAQDKDPAKLGAVARLADPVRATTALAVFKDDG